MTLPESRNTTYIANVTQVKSADLNDMQDKIIDLHGRTIDIDITKPANSGGYSSIDLYDGIKFESGTIQLTYFHVPMADDEQIVSAEAFVDVNTNAANQFEIGFTQFDKDAVTGQVANTPSGTGVNNDGSSETWVTAAAAALRKAKGRRQYVYLQAHTDSAGQAITVTELRVTLKRLEPL